METLLALVLLFGLLVIGALQGGGLEWIRRQKARRRRIRIMRQMTKDLQRVADQMAEALMPAFRKMTQAVLDFTEAFERK